jgi:hypothetical protein
VIPFLVFGMTSPGYPADLFAVTPTEHGSLNYALSGSALRISGGWFQDEQAADEGKWASPSGFVGTDAEKRQFGEQVLASLAHPDDRVLIVDEEPASACDPWTGLGDAVRVRRISRERVVVVTAAGMDLARLHWAHWLLPACTIQLFASRGVESPTERAILDAAEQGENVSRTAWGLARNARRDPQAALNTLGDFGFWAFLGEFDAQDLVIVRQEADVTGIRDSLTNIAAKVGIMLYDAGTLEQMDASGFFIEDQELHQIPDNWERLVE